MRVKIMPDRIHKLYWNPSEWFGDFSITKENMGNTQNCEMTCIAADNQDYKGIFSTSLQT